MLEVPFSSGGKIREAAADRSASRSRPPAAGVAAETPWDEPRRPRMAGLPIDRTFEGFLQNVGDAVLEPYPYPYPYPTPSPLPPTSPHP